MAENASSRSFFLTQPGLAVLVVSLLFFGAQTLMDLAATLLPALTPRLLDKDFGNYWIGAREALAGQGTALFDPVHYQRLLAETFPASQVARNWSYPPHFLLMIWPLGLLPYPIAYLLFQLVTGALFWAAARAAVPHVRPLDLALGVSGLALVNINAGQNGFLIGAFILGAVALRDRAPFIAGLLIACLTVKPQLGLLIPLILLLEKRFMIFAGAAIGTLALTGVSILLFGMEAWRGYFAGTADMQQTVLTEWEGIFQWMMPTLFSGLRALGVSPAAAGWAQVPLSITMLAAVVFVAWRRSLPGALRLAIYAAASILVTPYAFVYDLGFVVVLVLGVAFSLPLSLAERSGLIILTGLSPVLFMGAWLAFIPAAPLMMMALFVWLFLLSIRQPGDNAQQNRDVLRT